MCKKAKLIVGLASGAMEQCGLQCSQWTNAWRQEIYEFMDIHKLNWIGSIKFFNFITMNWIELFKF